MRSQESSPFWTLQQPNLNCPAGYPTRIALYTKFWLPDLNNHLSSRHEFRVLVHATAHPLRTKSPGLQIKTAINSLLNRKGEIRLKSISMDSRQVYRKTFN